MKLYGKRREGIRSVREGFILKKVKKDGNFHVGGGGLGHSIMELLFFCMGSESSRNAIKKFSPGGGVRDILLFGNFFLKASL